MSDVILFDYPKSSASYRVRIALHLAGIDYKTEQVNLLEGAQNTEQHLARNPQGFVPVLDIDGLRLTQSLAIIEYLDTTRQLGLLPQTPVERAKVQALSHAIAIDIHPICNLSVAKYATNGEEPARTQWMQHFIGRGLNAFEQMLSAFEQTPYATGDAPSLADICLIPQLYNAHRWGAKLDDFERIKSVEAACTHHPAFIAAAP